MKNLIIDTNNLLYRTFYGNLNSPDKKITYSLNKKYGGIDDLDTFDNPEIDIEIIFHSFLQTSINYFKTHRPDRMIFAVDSFSWRKAYTADTSICVTKKKYKGTRKQKLSTSQLETLTKFEKNIPILTDFLRNDTSCIVLQRKMLEADDLIAGYVHNFPDDDNVIISGDKDYIQLLRNAKIQLINPDDNKPRTLDDWNNDADYFMFEKCFRGDISDNVQSAYPRIRSTRIKKAYSDDYERNAVLNESWEDHTGKYCVGDLFKENQLLMDLTKQPEEIKALVESTINLQMENRGKFNLVSFFKFCKKYNMQKILNTAETFIPMFSLKI